MSAGVDPSQGSWMQLAFNAILAAFGGLLALVMSSWRGGWEIYRKKVDALEEKHAAVVATCITRDELGDILKQRFESTDALHLQMHNHNASLLQSIEKRLAELRDDNNTVHRRIDALKK